MKVDFDTSLKTLEGTIMKEQFGEEKDVEKDYRCKCGEIVKVIIKDREARDLKLSSVCVNALLANYEDEKNLSGDDKVKRYALAQKIQAGGVVDLSAENIVLLKKLVGKGYGVAVVGQTLPTLEGN